MRNWAELDDLNNVIRVVICDTQEWLIENLGGNWVESFNPFGDPALRYNPAEPQGIYDPVNNAFIPKKPFSSWVLNEQIFIWEPPVPYPSGDKEYLWNEQEMGWIEVQ